MRPPINPRADERDTNHLLAVFDLYGRAGHGGNFVRTLSLIQWPHRRHPHIYIGLEGTRW